MEKPLFNYDNHSLREIPQDPEALKQFILELKMKLKSSTSTLATVQLLGEVGVHLRILLELNEAEEALLKAIELINNHNLDVKTRIQQEIRLAHVYQWKKDFQKSNKIFEQVIENCYNNIEAQSYLDFALQHCGKNFFDQTRYQEALDCFKKSLLIRIEKKSPVDQIASTQQALRETKKRLGLQENE